MSGKKVLVVIKCTCACFCFTFLGKPNFSIAILLTPTLQLFLSMSIGFSVVQTEGKDNHVDIGKSGSIFSSVFSPKVYSHCGKNILI